VKTGKTSSDVYVTFTRCVLIEIGS
jgi:hypothetical protein